MSILIKGMTMPKNCGDCPLLNHDSPCWKNGGAVDWENRPNWCPLIELSPHGDLIDRDAVYKRIHKAIDDDPQLSDVYVEDAQIVTEWLRTEPTIIESEEEK